MGCTASKLHNEDTVRRCKERRRFMKDAVFARHHLAAAHSDYCRSLRLTGSALSSFAAGEPLSVSSHSPAILLPTPTSSNPTPPRVAPHQQKPLNSSSSHPNYFQQKQKTHTTHSDLESNISLSPPPKNPTNNYHHNFTRKTHTTTTTANMADIDSSAGSRSPPEKTKKTRKPKIKVPHILSESSINSTPQTKNNRNYTYNATNTYSTTASQTSSVWNWENFYPPSPPDSDFFNNQNHQNHYKYNHQDDDMSSINSSKNYHQVRQHQHHLTDTEEEEEEEEEAAEAEEREEVQCSEWGDHYSSSTNSTPTHVEEDDYEMTERESRSDIGGGGGPRSNFGSSVKTASFRKHSEKFEEDEDDGAGSSVSWNMKNNNNNINNNNNNNNSSSRRYGSEIGGGGEDMRIVVRHRDLAEIVAALKEYFDKAAVAGEQVAEMLETGRAQLDRSFSSLKKTVYHSSGVLSNLSSTWTSKPPLAVKYRFEPGSMYESGGSKSLCSTLERLLAWEKKLYQEVKAREGVKIEHEKKLSTLQSQEYRGDEVKLDKTKASIKRLQSLILVTSQAVSTTSTAINGLRDAELVPQLVELCHGFMYMWRSMNQFHEVQNHIVQQVRGLVNRSAKGESTSDLHRQATHDLESAVSAWHSCFCRLIKFQRDFIYSLHGWFKLSVIPVNEPTTDNKDFSEALAFCDEWKLALDRVPDTVASEAIKSFINVVHSISLKQAEELKIKKRTESASKELEKKASSLRNIEKKYYQSYSMVGIGLPDTGPDSGHALDARDPLSEKKSELAASQRRVEDEMVRHSKAVEITRAMTLNNIQTGLPGVFQAMTSFSALIMEALEVVCTRSYAIK